MAPVHWEHGVQVKLPAVSAQGLLAKVFSGHDGGIHGPQTMLPKNRDWEQGVATVSGEAHVPQVRQVALLPGNRVAVVVPGEQAVE